MTWARRFKKPAAKYGSEKVADLCKYGHGHRSKLERAVCDLVWLRELAKELVHLQHECTVYLTKARYKYIPDFRVKDAVTGEEFYIEAKGFADKRWPTTKKLWKHYGPARLEIWGGDYRRPRLDQTIIPEPAETACDAACDAAWERRDQ